MVGKRLPQVPPPGVALSVSVPPHPTVPAPTIALGMGYTVITIEVGVEEYDIVVVPADRPTKSPPDDTVPTAGLELIQVPPAGLPERGVKLLAHTEKVPVICPDAEMAKQDSNRINPRYNCRIKRICLRGLLGKVCRYIRRNI
jgi:hypothetical protein